MLSPTAFTSEGRLCPGQHTTKAVKGREEEVLHLTKRKLGHKTITESQNHRMAGVGRDLCGSSSPTLLPKQGHPEQAA